MLKDRDVTFGELQTVIYDFEFKGDVLPEHKHPKGQTHITICAKGEVEVITPEWKKILKEGNIIEFHPNQYHSIVAVTDDCRIVNIPTSYAKP
jgi:quercetin dioxygenase-like cupin family protein